MTEETSRPPLLDYVPYVRTDEVYHMDPLAPLSRPPTHEAQQRIDTGEQITDDLHGFLMSSLTLSGSFFLVLELELFLMLAYNNQTIF